MTNTMRTLEENFTAEEILEMKKEEAQWLMDVLDLDKHKTLKNPYEVKKEKGTSSQTRLGV